LWRVGILDGKSGKTDFKILPNKEFWGVPIQGLGLMARIFHNSGGSGKLAHPIFLTS